MRAQRRQRLGASALLIRPGVVLASAILAFVCTTPVGAQTQPAISGSSSLANSGLRMVLSLLLVLGLLAACAWATRRWRDRRQPGTDSIEIVSGVTLGSKERVVLLRVADEQILVGLSPAGMRSLHVVRDADAPVPFRARLEAVE